MDGKREQSRFLYSWRHTTVIKIIKTTFFFFILVATTFSLSRCSNADMAQLFANGSDAHITCYSGGQIIYNGYSQGKVETEKASDGWYFKDKETHKLMRISGTCIIQN